LRLLECRAAWPQWLAGIHDGALEALFDFLKTGATASKSTPASSAVRDDIHQVGAAAGRLQSWQGPTCITRHKNGYKVVVTWASLSVCTGFTKTLTQAIDWQIVLLKARSTAQTRSSAVLGSAGLCQAGRPDAFDPLTEEELLQMLEAEPSLDLTFTVAVHGGGRKGKTTYAPSVQDLRQAMDFRRRFLAASLDKKPEAELKKEKSRAEKEAAESRKKRRDAERSLSLAVTKELKARKSGAAVRPAGAGLPKGSRSSAVASENGIQSAPSRGPGLGVRSGRRRAELEDAMPATRRRLVAKTPAHTVSTALVVAGGGG
jgi:hypothetical protein